MGAGSSAARYKSELLEESKRIAERSASAAVEEDNLAALRDEVQNLRTQLAAARAAADGAEAEFARRAELWLETDKEMRLGHLLITAARRLSRFALARGWTAWLDAVKSRRLVQAAVGRMTRPALSSSFARWRSDWHAAASARAKLQESKRKAAESEVERLSRGRDLEAAASMRAMEEAAQRAEAQLVQLRDELQREREGRADRLKHVALRRMKSQGVARAWTTWLEAYRQRAHARRLLLKARGRLARPRLSHALQHWRRDHEAEAAAKAARVQELLLQRAMAAESEAEARLSSARDQLARLRPRQLPAEDEQPSKAAASHHGPDYLRDTTSQRMQLRRAPSLGRAGLTSSGSAASLGRAGPRGRGEPRARAKVPTSPPPPRHFTGHTSGQGGASFGIEPMATRILESPLADGGDGCLALTAPVVRVSDRTGSGAALLPSRAAGGVASEELARALHRAERAETAEAEARVAADHAALEAKAGARDAEVQVLMAVKRAEKAELIASKLSRRLQATVSRAAADVDGASARANSATLQASMAASHTVALRQQVEQQARKLKQHEASAVLLRSRAAANASTTLSFESLPPGSPTLLPERNEMACWSESEDLQPSMLRWNASGGWQPWSTWPLPNS